MGYRFVFKVKDVDIMKYQNELKLIFLELDGLFFQEFFNDLMKLHTPDFKIVRQKNDGGNDGFNPSEGVYFQVFSPEVISKSNVNNGASKIIKDFEKLLLNWHYAIKIKKYIFVYNDKQKGTDRELFLKIEKINNDYEVEAVLYDSRDLSRIFDGLDNKHKEFLVSKYTFGLGTVSAALTAAKVLKDNLPIERWKYMDDEYLIFNCILESDIDNLNEIAQKLFSMSFLSSDEKMVDNLVKSITNFTSIFNSPLTRSFNGERQWDNSWKGECYPHPRAEFFDRELAIWEKKVSECTFDFCKSLNEFVEHIRNHHKQDYLDYKSYTITRRTGEYNEYTTFKP